MTAKPSKPIVRKVYVRQTVYLVLIPLGRAVGSGAWSWIPMSGVFQKRAEAIKAVRESPWAAAEWRIVKASYEEPYAPKAGRRCK